MAFHEYPYTDFHEMNLDWVIKKVKELATAWAQVQQDWTDEQAAFANLQSWIENYFNNLNVQTEINVKLDAMVEAGTMSELIAPFVASGLPAVVADQIGAVVASQIGPVVAAQIGAVVADQLPAIAASAAATEVGTWLSTHIDPDTGYVIDDSLTVQGAAADSKAVGDEVTAIKSALSFGCASFTVLANGSHSSLLNQIVIGVKQGEKYTITITLDSAKASQIASGIFEYHNGANIGTNPAGIPANTKTKTFTYTANADIDAFGLYVESVSSDTTFYISVENSSLGILGDIRSNIFTLEDNIKRFNLCVYLQNYGKFTYDGAKFTVPTGIMIRPLSDGGYYLVSPSDLLAKASAAGLTVDADTNTITFGAIGFMYYDISANDVGFSTSWINNSMRLLLYGYSYGTRLGVLLDYATAQKATENEAKITELETDVEYDGVPSYYRTHLSNKTATARNNMMDVGMSGETFVFISDIHWDNNNRNSPALVKNVLNNLNINFLLCGGDLINEGAKTTMAKDVVECIRAFNIKNTFFPCAFGNHDSNKNNGNPQANWFDENAEYALMQKQSENKVTYFTTTGWNFYFDSIQTKTRWIVVDTQENGAFTWYDELCALLNNTPSSYHVIISGHWFYNSDAKSTFAINLESIVDAFNAKSTVTIDETTYDFSASDGIIPFVIGGHMHKDMDWTTTGGTPFILTDCDNGPRSSNTDYPYVRGTITEQAFDVVTVDYTNKTVKCVRVGRGADRTFSYS